MSKKKGVAKRKVSKKGTAAALTKELAKVAAVAPSSQLDSAFYHIEELAADALREEEFFQVFAEDSDEMMDLVHEVAWSAMDSLPQLVWNWIESHPEYKRFNAVVEAAKKNGSTKGRPM